MGVTDKLPVTVSITRHLDPDHSAQMLAWVRSGSQLAERFDGFLGSGWVRPSPESDEWHMLYRFADVASLEVRQASEQRRWWLGSGQGIVGESKIEKRTGIEGWFDEPVSTDVLDLRAKPAGPPRWKQMCVIFVVFFPLSLLSNYLGQMFLGDVALSLRALVSVCAMTPIMTYLALPWVTWLFAPWLNGSRPKP